MKLTEFLVSFSKLFFRGRQTLGQNLKLDKVTLEYWQERVNIGDQLAPVIFDWMLEKNGIENRCHGIKHLNTIGSIIGIQKYDAVIWGSGVLSLGYAKSIFKFGRLVKYDVRAVRGPFTQEILALAGHEAPYIYGDPGILMPQIYPPSQLKRSMPFLSFTIFPLTARKGQIKRVFTKLMLPRMTTVFLLMKS